MFLSPCELISPSSPPTVLFLLLNVLNRVQEFSIPFPRPLDLPPFPRYKERSVRPSLSGLGLLRAHQSVTSLSLSPLHANPICDPSVWFTFSSDTLLGRDFSRRGAQLVPAPFFLFSFSWRVSPENPGKISAVSAQGRKLRKFRVGSHGRGPLSL